MHVPTTDCLFLGQDFFLSSRNFPLPAPALPPSLSPFSLCVSRRIKLWFREVAGKPASQ